LVKAIPGAGSGRAGDREAQRLVTARGSKKKTFEFTGGQAAV